ncbi:unnamed protein product [Boreogadus saida]
MGLGLPTLKSRSQRSVGRTMMPARGPGPQVIRPPAATPSTKRQSAGRVLTDAVLQLQRETIDGVNNLTEEMRQIRNVITEIATILKDTVKK